MVQLVDGSGTITKTYNYDAFGVEYDVDEDDDNYFRYAGQYYDTETGTYYLRARYYNPGNGRFTQQDGWGYANFGDPLSLNLYTYCYNNPIAYLDPSGHIIVLAEGATEGQKQAYERAIEYLKTSEDGRKLIEELENSKEVFTIDFISDDDNSYDPSTKEIFWNISRGAILADEKSVQSPALILVHEMGHAAQHLNGDLDDYFNDKKTVVEVEADNLAKYENPIAKQLGEYTRKDYDDVAGKKITVGSSTDWGVIVTVHPWYYYLSPVNWGKPSKAFRNQNPWAKLHGSSSFYTKAIF